MALWCIKKGTAISFKSNFPAHFLARVNEQELLGLAAPDGCFGRWPGDKIATIQRKV